MTDYCLYGNLTDDYMNLGFLFPKPFFFLFLFCPYRELGLGCDVGRREIAGRTGRSRCEQRTGGEGGKRGLNPAVKIIAVTY